MPWNCWILLTGGGHGGHALEHGVGWGRGEAHRYIYLCSDPLRTGETRRNGRQKARKDEIGSNLLLFSLSSAGSKGLEMIAFRRYRLSRPTLPKSLLVNDTAELFEAPADAPWGSPHSSAPKLSGHCALRRTIPGVNEISENHPLVLKLIGEILIQILGVAGRS